MEEFRGRSVPPSIPYSLISFLYLSMFAWGEFFPSKLFTPYLILALPIGASSLHANPFWPQAHGQFQPINPISWKQEASHGWNRFEEFIVNLAHSRQGQNAPWNHGFSGSHVLGQGWKSSQALPIWTCSFTLLSFLLIFYQPLCWTYSCLLFPHSLVFCTIYIKEIKKLPL